MTISSQDIKIIIGYGIELVKKYGPLIDAYVKERGHMPSLDEIEAMHKIGKDPEDYFRKKTS